ncbi:MerR family transcriptional regulator [Fluviibacterium sp. S390]|uniref:MerR family transcriptional regulator n=1 Tax=Fluviibacterium sp. S390 TaxID=3415139 RepID=UPI003C7A7E16
MTPNDTFILSQVADIAGVPRNTLRDWLRRDYFGIKRTKGWTRFRIDEVAIIGVYADVLKRTKGDHELALAACKSAYGAFSTQVLQEERTANNFHAVLHATRDDDGTLRTWISDSNQASMEYFEEVSTSHPDCPVHFWVDLASSFMAVFVRASEISKANGDEDE